MTQHIAIGRTTTLPGDAHLFTLAPPSAEELQAGAVPSAAFRALTDLDAEYLLERFGDTDLLGSAETMLRGFADRSSTRQDYALAARGPVAARLADQGVGALPAAVAPGEADPSEELEVIAYLGASLGLLDNTSSIDLEVFVRAAHRGRGIGSALWDLGIGTGRSAGRSTVQAWVDHESPVVGAEQLVPTRSEGAIARDAAARFALAHGLVLEQVERHSVLRTAGRDGSWREQLADAGGHLRPTDEPVTWTDATPEEDLPHMAELFRRMSTDVPLGGLDWEEEAWDAERVRRSESTYLAGGQRHLLTTAVRDTATGVLVAFSRITVPKGRAAAWQQDTLVMKEHRGHRLGTVVKLVNQLALLERFPEVERVHTWNAFENRHMLDVNHAVGFELATLAGAWQGRIA